MSDKIIVAESKPDEGWKEDDKFLHLPELTPEETAEIAKATLEKPVVSNKKAAFEKMEPLFTEVGGADSNCSERALLEDISKIDAQTASTIISASEIFKTCVLPDKTELQERILKTKNDILVGDHCVIDYGLYGSDVVVSELCELTGDIVAEGDLRIDNFCDINGTVICNGDAYIGEGVKIHGKLTVGGNLDIGDNVTIDKEFKAFGDIAIRNPMPVILYLLLYIMTMLNIEGEEKVTKRIQSIISEANSEPLVLPPRTTMNLSSFSVPTPMVIGSNCRLHGNLKAQTVKIKKDTTLFGSVHGVDRVKIGARDAIHGDVAGVRVRVERGADILGDVAGKTVWLHEDAHVSGVIRAEDGLTIGRSETP